MNKTKNRFTHNQSAHKLSKLVKCTDISNTIFDVKQSLVDIKTMRGVIKYHRNTYVLYLTRADLMVCRKRYGDNTKMHNFVDSINKLINFNLCTMRKISFWKKLCDGISNQKRIGWVRSNQNRKNILDGRRRKRVPLKKT